MEHICGQCNKKFKSEDGYLKHECEVTGHKPTEPEHVNFVPKEEPKVEVPEEPKLEEEPKPEE